MQKVQGVKILRNTSSSCSCWGYQEFDEVVGKFRQPLVLRGWGVGPCVEKWSPEYLISTGGGKRVKVHKCGEARLDFLKKNFSYETITFGELVKNCANVDDKSGADDKTDAKKFWYLRSLGQDPRGKDVSDLSVHFPDLNRDLKIPPFFPPEAFFSSVFRISSPGLQLWTHYDTCDNILVQVKGTKRVILFPPGDALNLYLEGDKSLVLDVDKPDLQLYPDLQKVTRYEAVLEEGDILFIPALWFHNITALSFSVSVNVFWRNLEAQFYDKKDTYGNRELVPAQLAFKTFDKAAAQLSQLPKDYEDFYLRRMIIALRKRIDKLKLESGEESGSSRDD